MTRNQIAYAEHIRQQRADQEIKRSNLEKEANNRNVTAETIRHNRVGEEQNNRSIDEVIRHNRASEGIGYANVSLGYANIAQHDRQLAEMSRANRQQEYLKGVELNNQARRDIDTYNLNLYTANLRKTEGLEQQRTNRENENIKRDILSKDYLSILSNPLRYVVGGLS